MSLLLLALACRPAPPPASEPGAVDPNDKVLRRARSTDGRSWELLPGTLAVQASSPDLVEVRGEPWVYFVHRGERLARVPLMGGAVELIDLDLGGGLVVDPDLVTLPDGSLRMYLVHQEAERDPGAGGLHNRIHSARSADGLHWRLEEGPVLEGPYVDPDVVDLGEGRYRMYLTRGATELLSAQSEDGRLFGLEPGTRLQGGGVSSTLRGADGHTTTWFHERWGIRRAQSADGLRYGPSDLVLRGADLGPGLAAESPAVLQHDGEYWMVLAQAPDPQAAP